MSATLDHASQLEQLLLAHDITVFGYERVGALAIVRFEMNGTKLRLVVPMPDWESDEYRLTPTGKVRSITERRRLYWADVAKTWKAMRNLIAAKLEGIEAGITTFEAEFDQFRDGVALVGSGNES